MQCLHRIEDLQSRPYCALGIILMGLGVAEVHQETITQELGDMPIVALDNFGTHPLICTHHVTPVFRVELAGQLGGIDQVAEHHRELSTFSFGYLWFERWCDLRGLIV